MKSFVMLYLMAVIIICFEYGYSTLVGSELQSLIV